MVTWTSFDAPAADYTQGWQINNSGQIAVSGFGSAGSVIFLYCPEKGTNGVCKGDANKEKHGLEKTVTGKGNLHAPEAGRKGSDPDAKPSKHVHRR